jgi:hypothetical protein
MSTSLAVIPAKAGIHPSTSKLLIRTAITRELSATYTAMDPGLRRDDGGTGGSQ